MSGYKTPFQKYFLAGGFVFVLIVALFFKWMSDYVAYQQKEAEALHRFKEYKIHETSTLVPRVKVAGPNGEMVDLIDGKHYTILNIWATWCAPCVSELPALKRLGKILSYDNEWRVVAVSIDAPKDIEKVAFYVNKIRVKEIASYHDINADLQKSMNIKGLPMTLILNKRGEILYEVYGEAIWYDASIVSFLRALKIAK